MRTHVSWSLALVALVVSGSLLTGCKSSKGRKRVDGGHDSGMDVGDGGDAQVDSDAMGPDGGPPLTPGFKVTPSTGLQTREEGGEATFKVQLSAPPTGDVTIALSSDDVMEGTVSPTQLVFNATTWNAEQIVTVKGVDDLEEDGDAMYKILLGIAQSSDARYQGMDPPDVSVVNIDNDTAGFTLADNVDVKTNESGTQDTFTVRLNTRPTANVTVALSSSDTTEVTQTPPTLVFTPDNWNAPQTVTVKGVDDLEADGNVQVTITTVATSTDARYNNLDIADVMVTNEDNDTAGFRVVPTSGLRTNENGRQDRFTVALATQPTANVSIAVSSNATDEATVGVSSLTFTRDNWNAPQTVVVTGVNDDLEDMMQPFTIVLAPATSTDARYMGVDPPDVTGSNTDNDTAGITVDGADDLVVSEAGGLTSFTVYLNNAPTGNVTIALTSSDAGEATVSPANLVFTTSNWNSPQTVTITGVDDSEVDGPQEVTIDLDDPVSDDARYADLTGPSVKVTVTDNETSGFAVAESEPFETDESGGQTSFTIALTTRPSANVTIPVASADVAEITLSATSLTFTPANWNSPQTVTLTGVDDDLIDGRQPVVITLGTATSTDPAYQGKEPEDLLAYNVDNDSAGVTVNPIVGLSTSENGDQASFTVRLNSKPTANVSFPLVAPDTSEATISATMLTFTDVNWNAPQTVTLTGVDDDVADGPQLYVVQFGPGASTDERYAGFDIPDLLLVNNDNDSPGVEFLDASNVALAPTAVLTTTEDSAGQAVFRVRLRSQPTAPVTIAVSSSDPSEGTVAPATLVFNADDWRAPQSITITGANDDIADGPQNYQVTFAITSADSGYDGRAAGAVNAQNIDDDAAGVTVTPTTPPNLIVNEAGRQATFTIRLNSQPTVPVTIPISVSNPAEATISPTSVTFDATDWRGAKPVTITGLGDLRPDGNQQFQVNFGPIAGGANYTGITVPPLTVTNRDTDSAQINVDMDGPLTTTETGTQVPFRISLGAQPDANVTIRFVSDDTTEATVSPSFVTFTPTDYGADQVVVVTGVDDLVADRDQTFHIQILPAETTGLVYAGRSVEFLTGTNIDNDTAGVLVSRTNDLSVTEGGATDSFTVQLTSQPNADINIPVRVLEGTEARAGATNNVTLTFTPGNWLNPQTVTITSIDDNPPVADGNQPITVALGPVVATNATADDNYNGMAIPNVTGLSNDDDVPGLDVRVDPNPLNPPIRDLGTAEAIGPGNSDTFQIRLLTRPMAPVTLTAASTATDEGTVAPATLTIQPDDWNQWQTFTVSGANDDVADGNQTYYVDISSSSDDNRYDITGPRLTALNLDDDSPGILVQPASGNVPATTEAGDTSTFTVKLKSQPTQSVSVSFSVDKPSEVSLSTNTLTFTAANWNQDQTVTVTGLDDFVDDGNAEVRIVFAGSTSDDPDYVGLTIQPIVGQTYLTVFNNDNDNAGVEVVGRELVIYDGATSDTFQVRLTSQPLGDVTVPLTNSDPAEADISPTSLVFTPSNWNVYQVVTVSNRGDLVVDGHKELFITSGLTSSTSVLDTPYNAGLTGLPVQVWSYDAGQSCRTLKETLTALPPAYAAAGGSGMYWLDPDLKGPAPLFRAYCDMTTVRGTATGGWTLLTWTSNSDDDNGTPYPGLAPCTDPTDYHSCPRASGVPTAALDTLFDLSSELGQGQAITDGALKTSFSDLKDYEIAGSFVYGATPGALANLTVATGAATCGSLQTGTFARIAGPATVLVEGETLTLDGTTVYLNQGLVGSPDTSITNYAADTNNYVFSLGNRTGYCAINGTPPASFLGTWLEDVQYGPAAQARAGSYSVWVR